MQQKNKILHFHPDGLFASKFVWPIIEYEREAGFSSNLVVSENLSNFGTICIPYNINFKNIFFLFASMIRIYRLLLLEKPYIVISHNSRSSFVVLICAWLAKVPKRIYFNHGVPYIAYRGAIRYLFIIIEFINLLISNNVVTVSKDMVYYLNKINKNKSIKIINNGSACGIDLSQYEEKNYLNSTFRYEYQINSDDFVVVYLGRAVKRKGFNLTLEIWKTYFDNKNSKLILCGPTDSDVFNVLGYLPDNIISLGFTSRVPEILSQSDCLILPSLHEGLSYATLEAMASGCIVIANNIPGIQCLVQSNVNGFLIVNNELEKYGELLTKISTNLNAYRYLILSNAINTSKKYSREIFLKFYLKFLNEIILVNK